MRVLALFAHPDDIELLCAGTLRLLVERGWELRCVTMTRGDLGAIQGTRDHIGQTRRSEAAQAAAVLGGTYACVGLNDLEITYNPATLRQVVDQVRDFEPDVVITHSPECYLVDHEETARLVRAACFAAPIPLYESTTAPTPSRVPALYYSDALEGLDKYGNEVRASFWIDITSVFPVREKALACHASQREWLSAHHGMDEYLLTNERCASQHGSKCSAPYAEGFRQHLGHGYPRQNIIADTLQDVCRPRCPKKPEF